MFRSHWPLICFALTGWVSSASPARAQDVVPGGWSTQVGFQSFPTHGSTGNAGGADFGRSGVAAVFAFGGVAPDASFAPTLPDQAKPQVLQIWIPLPDAVRRGTRKRPRR